MPERAVFLHSGWRSGGTWLWGQLRAQPGVRGFYEPLHEVLETIDATMIAAMTPGSWESRHGQAGPYFREYEPLLKARRLRRPRGVAGYLGRFAYERSFLAPGEADDALRDYIAGLLHTAAAEGRVPVLKFCRSLGRVAWMRQQFPGGLHAVILRDPVAQWHSSVAQLAADNRFFVVGPMLVLARNRRNALVGEAAERLAVRLPALPERRSPLDAELCWRHFRRLDPAERYRGFLAFWTVSAIAALGDGESLVIDADRLAVDKAHLATVEAELQRHTGAEIQLQPIRQPAPPTAPEDAGAAHAAAASMVAAHRTALGEAACAAIVGKLAAAPKTFAALRRPPAWFDADATGASAALRQQAYFAAMRASMPLRRAHPHVSRAVRHFVSIKSLSAESGPSQLNREDAESAKPREGGGV